MDRAPDWWSNSLPEHNSERNADLTGFKGRSFLPDEPSLSNEDLRPVGSVGASNEDRCLRVSSSNTIQSKRRSYSRGEFVSKLPKPTPISAIFRGKSTTRSSVLRKQQRRLPTPQLPSQQQVLTLHADSQLHSLKRPRYSHDDSPRSSVQSARQQPPQPPQQLPSQRPPSHQRKKRLSDCQSRQDSEYLTQLPSPPSTGAIVQVGGVTVETGQLIATGGYSKVYAVTDVTTKRRLALKVVDLQLDERNEVMRPQLIAEARLLEQLRDVDHIVQLVAHVVTTNHIHLLLERAEGDLGNILNGRTTSKLDLDFVRYWGGQVLKAVHVVHAHNIVHSDLKPPNFLVVNGVLKLTDFGISDEVPDNGTSVIREVPVGTLEYMAPETLRCWTTTSTKFKVTTRSDIWSCGVILYLMVYNVVPYKRELYAQHVNTAALPEVEHPKLGPGNVRVPMALHEVVRGCLQLDPKHRMTAEAAIESMFFSVVSVDFAAVECIMRHAFEFGYKSGLANKEVSKERLEKQAKKLYQRLADLNT